MCSIYSTKKYPSIFKNEFYIRYSTTSKSMKNVRIFYQQTLLLKIYLTKTYLSLGIEAAQFLKKKTKSQKMSWKSFVMRLRSEYGFTNIPIFSIEVQNTEKKRSLEN